MAGGLVLWLGYHYLGDGIANTVAGLEGLMQDGVTFKYLREPLTAAQVAEVIQVPK